MTEIIDVTGLTDRQIDAIIAEKCLKMDVIWIEEDGENIPMQAESDEGYGPTSEIPYFWTSRHDAMNLFDDMLLFPDNRDMQGAHITRIKSGYTAATHHLHPPYTDNFSVGKVLSEVICEVALKSAGIRLKRSEEVKS